MHNQLSTRKRGDLGTVPTVQQRTEMALPAVQDIPPLPTDQYQTWDAPDAFSTVGTAYPEPPTYDSNFFGGGVNDGLARINGTPVPNGQPLNSNQLVRRDRNQQLATINRAPWQDFPAGTNPQVGTWDNSDDEDDLEARALAAKREAQAKRKQIPPFVQKLSSFLDDERNTDLIRWSDDGLSFIVLNEDEFAKTLIPELFKHSNYASFVRQLNMYGFHKKVGLSDNSMKSSEQKVKNPSEYYNKYFRRGRPELFWLIQKPKNSSSSKRKREDDRTKGDADSEEEGKKFPSDLEARPTGGQDGLVRRNQEMAMIPVKELNNLRRELQQVQQQQQVISSHINKIRQQNEQLYHQATAFQTLHERHENSINAILTFLATFYNRQLDQNTAPNLQDMFQQAIPQNQQPHGNVVDVGDYNEGDMEATHAPQRSVKRPLALLPAPVVRDAPSPLARTTSRTQSIRSPSARPASRQSIFKSSVPMSRSPSVQRSSPPITPNADSTGQNIENQGGEDIMSVINSANANSGSGNNHGSKLDFAAALNHFQNAAGNNPLTPQQRNDMLSMIAANSPNGTSAAGGIQSNNNALINPNPPPMPSLDQFAATQAQLDLLQKMQEDQDSKVQHIADRLTPLSPSGSIPGFATNGSPTGQNFSLNHYGTSGNHGAGTGTGTGNGDADFDVDNFVNSGDFYTDPDGTVQFSGPELDHSFSGMDLNQPLDFGSGFGLEGNTESFNGLGHVDSGTPIHVKDESDGRVESISSETTASPVNSGPSPLNAGPSPLGSPKKKKRRKS